MPLLVVEDQARCGACADHGLDETGFGKIWLEKALVSYVISERREVFKDLVTITDPHLQACLLISCIGKELPRVLTLARNSMIILLRTNAPRHEGR